MKTDIMDLLASVHAVKALAARVGLPDESALVAVTDVESFAASLDAAMRDFQALRPGTQTLVSAEVNTSRNEVWIRIVQNGPSKDRNGQIESTLTQSFGSLRAVAERDGGELHYWGGDNYFDVRLPYPEADRDDFPEVEDLPWDARYRLLLERESWGSLRDRVYRFSELAVNLASRCHDCRRTAVLIPSVGICVHPWLFANHGLSVVASDSSETALAALSEPGIWPNLYSSKAFDRWDISNCARYAMAPHPGRFDGMPALEDAHVREPLRQRISFVVADWAHIPVPNGTADLVFATNAVPRESVIDRRLVLAEWVRILRPGGVIYIAQHHAAADWGVETFLLEQGFERVDFHGGEVPGTGMRGGFQIRYSSG